MRSEGELGKLGKKLNSLCRRLCKSGQVFLIFTVRLKTGQKNAAALSYPFVLKSLRALALKEAFDGFWQYAVGRLHQTFQKERCIPQPDVDGDFYPAYGNEEVSPYCIWHPKEEMAAMTRN